MNEEKTYYMYVILTEDSTLYCGYTDDVEKRFEKHMNGTGAKYTKSHKPVKIVFTQEFKTKSEAMRTEYKFKRLKKEKKLSVISGYLNIEEL